MFELLYSFRSNAWRVRLDAWLLSVIKYIGEPSEFLTISSAFSKFSLISCVVREYTGITYKSHNKRWHFRKERLYHNSQNASCNFLRRIVSISNNVSCSKSERWKDLHFINYNSTFLSWRWKHSFAHFCCLTHWSYILKKLPISFVLMFGWGNCMKDRKIL